MSQTNIRGAQILNSTVQRQDLDTSTVGQAVITKIVQGSGISLSSTGADSGTGDVTVSSPDVVSTDAGNIATLGTDNHILVPQSQIWSVRLRSFNAIGNPTFEVAQRNCRGAIINPGGSVMLEDRWVFATNLSATGQTFLTSLSAGQGVPVPGANFIITTAFLRATVGTQKTSLAASDVLYLQQNIEGPGFRELMSDVHSSQVLVRSSVANLKFSVYLKDPTGTRTLTKLCTLGAANTITLIQLPNLPIWPSAGTFTAAVGSAGYTWGIGLAGGSSIISPANDTWQNGNFGAALGQDNFMANAAGSTFEVFFIQHEPGALCTTPIDCPFTQNYDDCLRYFAKSANYGTKPGTIGNSLPAVFSYGLSQASNPVFYGNAFFTKRMAKVPTVTTFDNVGGSGNACYMTSGSFAGAIAVSLVQRTDGGIYQIQSPGSSTGWAMATFDWVADTGW
jgi:hypothetical protein